MRVFGAAILVLSLLPVPLVGQVVGDVVVLQSSNSAGVPVHPTSTANAYVRWANGTVATVASDQSTRGWIQVQAHGQSGWIVRSYATLLDLEEPEEDEELTYVVGTWNLEVFRDGGSRGFPENTRGGPSYGGRSDSDYNDVASIIRDDLDAKILILNEINGRSGQTTSVELDRMLGFLGSEWRYELSAAGGSMRVAMLYNTNFVERRSCFEITVAPELVVDGSDDKDIFARDPLVCRFTFQSGGTAMNDIVVVGLHLASQQFRVNNHNRAMDVLLQRLDSAVTAGALPSDEFDILIGGDLNASRYDTRLENFWTNFDQPGFDFEVLAPVSGNEYSGTRLSGVPLVPRSQIDYLLAASRTGGLFDELSQNVAHVHTEVLPGDFNDFRRDISDHLPVTVRIRVMADGDPGN